MEKIELLSPAGSLLNLKAAVANGADAVYLGMQKFGARALAKNFSLPYLREAVQICRSNNVKVFLTMNTLIKNSELRKFFHQLETAYATGVDAVIVQHISFLDFIKQHFPGLKVHLSTQAGVMNSEQANFLAKADRINLARELSKNEIINIQNKFSGKLEIFVHGALCVCVSGSCLFSSFLGGRSGNRGRCAQPCRKIYNGEYYLSTKELNLITKIPEIIKMGITAIKIEGRMRTPSYVAATTSAYRKAIDSYYAGHFQVNELAKLQQVFSREFTTGKFDSDNIFNRKCASARKGEFEKQNYQVTVNQNLKVSRERIKVTLPLFTEKPSSGKKLIVRVYNQKDALAADAAGADIIYYDLFREDFLNVKNSVRKPVYAVTPRIMLDSDLPEIRKRIFELKPAGILAGNFGILNLHLPLPIHLDYNLNCFNDFDIHFFDGALSIISPELSLAELTRFKNKNFITLVHGKIRLMTLMHDLPETTIIDEKGGKFRIGKIFRGSEIVNDKELGFLSKSRQLADQGVNQFFIDTDQQVEKIVELYRRVLDHQKVQDHELKNKYVLGWAFRGVKSDI